MTVTAEVMEYKGWLGAFFSQHTAKGESIVNFAAIKTNLFILDIQNIDQKALSLEQESCGSTYMWF